MFALFLASAFAADHAIDSDRTKVEFELTHMLVDTIHGSFTDITGTVSWDPAKPEATQAVVTIPIASVNTGSAKRDRHLQQGDLFDAAKWPAATFTSTSVREVDGDDFELVGVLDMHGVKKEVVLDVRDMGTAGATATTTLDRYDWGIRYGRILEGGGLSIGQQVRLTIRLGLKGAATKG